jgi:hypothetical protein
VVFIKAITHPDPPSLTNLGPNLQQHGKTGE